MPDDQKLKQTIADALHDVLMEDNEGSGKPILIKRIPIICNDIRDIKNDMRWLKWIGSGFIGAAGLLALKALGL